MRFDSKNGQELRTWILFFVGIAIAVIFAVNGNPLNPWWTLVIGAFTCTAVIVSAVQSIVGGMSDAARQAVDKAARNDSGVGPKTQDPPALPFAVGPSFTRPIWYVRGRNAIAI